MANDSFSFHCMICFEEFDPAVRYPVVLPCGHTYVCNECGARLDKCMECRTPLFMRIPREQQAVNGAHADELRWSSRRPAPSRSRGYRAKEESTPPRPPIKKRLPLPKNVVLLSLIEATELTTRDVQKDYSDSPKAAKQDSHASFDFMSDSWANEERKIKAGTSLAVGVAGTYAVSTLEGLDIYPRRPGDIDPGLTNASSDSDLDSIVRNLHPDQKGAEESREALSESPQSSSKEKFARLSCGDRVQVVSIDRGWAKLARGYGYVQADKNQLVKVGNSVDKACKLEAMIRSLSYRRRELRKEQNRVDNKFIRLMNDLQVSLQNDEDLTVICADTFTAPPSKMASEDRSVATRGSEALAVPSADENKEPHPADISKPPRLSVERPVTPPQGSPSLTCFAETMLSPGANSEGLARQISGALSNSFLPNFPEIPEGSQSASSVTARPASSFLSDDKQPSASDLRDGARAWRERHARKYGAGVDFRTGMSGHSALFSSHAHNPHDYLNSPSPTGKMSSHTGLSIKLSRIPLLGGLRLPVLGSSSPTQRVDSVPHSGSM